MEPSISRGAIGPLVRLLRYMLSPPAFDAVSDPAVLVVAPNPRFRWLRIAALAAVVLIGAVVVIGLGGTADISDRFEAVLALLAAGGMALGLTLLPKRLVATFGATEVIVQEGGIRMPRWRWTAPIMSFSGVAWRYRPVLEWYRDFQTQG